MHTHLQTGEKRSRKDVKSFTELEVTVHHGPAVVRDCSVLTHGRNVEATQRRDCHSRRDGVRRHRC